LAAYIKANDIGINDKTENKFETFWSYSGSNWDNKRSLEIAEAGIYNQPINSIKTLQN